MDEDPAIFRAALAQANGFTERELVENRSGRISRSQSLRLMIEALRPAATSGAVLAGWLLFLYYFDRLIPPSMLAANAKQGLYVVVSVATGGAFLLGLVRSCTLGVQVFLDLKEGECDTISGRVSTYTSSESEISFGTKLAGRSERYFYWIGDYKLEVNHAGYDLLMKRYDVQACPPMRLYFTPRSRLLLSAEPTLAARQNNKPTSIWLRPTG